MPHSTNQQKIILLCLRYIYNRRKRRSLRRWWVRPLNLNRNKYGQYRQLFLEMKRSDEEQFFKYTRMNIDQFNCLHDLVKLHLTKHSIRESIDSECRLALTLNYLSQGTTIQNIAWAYLMGTSTVRAIIKETCSVIWDILQPQYVKAPSETEFFNISNGNSFLWNLPNCVGSIDGKHINIQAPKNSGTDFFNYKKLYSVVLLAVCDHKYSFTLVDIGAYGSQSDGGILACSEFGKALKHKTLGIPFPKELPGTQQKFPHFFVGDEAFPLMENMMRPYPGRDLSYVKKIFNYRLSRARRVIENCFGILCTRWRIFRTTIIAGPQFAEKVIMASVCLHNFLMEKEETISEHERTYCPPNYVDTGDEPNGQWRLNISEDVLQSCGRVGSNVSSREVVNLRDEYAEYLCTFGAVPWQDERINRGYVPDSFI